MEDMKRERQHSTIYSFENKKLCLENDVVLRSEDQERKELGDYLKEDIGLVPSQKSDGSQSGLSMVSSTFEVSLKKVKTPDIDIGKSVSQLSLSATSMESGILCPPPTPTTSSPVPRKPSNMSLKTKQQLKELDLNTALDINFQALSLSSEQRSTTGNRYWNGLKLESSTEFPQTLWFVILTSSIASANNILSRFTKKNVLGYSGVKVELESRMMRGWQQALTITLKTQTKNGGTDTLVRTALSSMSFMEKFEYPSYSNGLMRTLSIWTSSTDSVLCFPLTFGLRAIYTHRNGTQTWVDEDLPLSSDVLRSGIMLDEMNVTRIMNARNEAVNLGISLLPMPFLDPKRTPRVVRA